MTPEQIRAELETFPPSLEALHAAVDAAAALSPPTIAALSRMADGVMPYPHEANFIVFAIHAMAAARRHEVWRPLLRALRTPDPELDYVFGDCITTSLTSIALSLFDGDPEPLIEAIEHPDADGFVRWSLLSALARLTHDGTVPRERTIAVIERFDRERLAADGDPAWEGWLEAIDLLGLASHADRARAALRDGRAGDREVDIVDWEGRIAQLGARSIPPEEFGERRLQPIDDVVAALEWLLPETDIVGDSADRAAESAEPGDDVVPDDDRDDDEETELADDAADPAGDLALSAVEMDWLRVFLSSRQVPPGTMSLDRLDGFLSALVVGPAAVPVEVWAEAIWGDGGSAKAFADRDQAEYVGALIKRHADAIGLRLERGSSHEPAIRNIYRGTGFQEWGEGFLRGVELSADAWQPLLSDRRRGAVLLAPILYAATRNPAIYRQGMAPIDGEEHLAEITQALCDLHEYWAQPPELRGPQRPVRAAPKPGRNQPCPCGSGKKYKRCCGSEVAEPASGASVLTRQ
jgi:yecA family protein